jgi:hypothetical protein
MDSKNKIPEHLKIITWNACSLFPKIDDLADTLTRYDIDIALIQETWLRPHTKLKITNYKIYRQDRPNTQNGGTAILIKQNIKHHEINTTDQDLLETTAIQTHTKNGPINIISTYKHPKTKLDKNCLDFYFKQNIPTILAGDLNCKHTAWGCRRGNQNGKILHNYTTENLITVHATDEPTHYHNETPDILDIAITKDIPCQIQTNILNELDSDHTPVLIVLGDDTNTNNQDKTTIDWTLFNILLLQNNITLEQINEQNTHKENIKILERNTITLQEHIQKALNDATITIPYKSPEHLTLPINIREQIKHRNRLKRQARLTGDPRINTEANRLTNQIKKQIKEHKNKRWTDKLNSINTENPNELWKMTKALTKNTKTNIPTLHSRQGLVFSDEEKAEAFADTFESQFSLNRHYTDDINHEQNIERQIKNIINQNTTPNEQIQPTDEQEVRAHIKKLKTKKAPGHDQITNKALKKLPQNTVQNLTLIINQILTLQHFPTTWKKSVVIPIDKPNADKKFPQNWRPISLIPSPAKIAEKIILNRLNDHIHTNNIIPDEQFGFRTQHSTEQQLARLTDNITTGLRQKDTTVLAFLDIQKAFDKVWHAGLIYKLKNTYNVPTTITKLIHSYLKNRLFTVRVNNTYSQTRTMEAGVPQGSALAPTLYNLYVADIPKTANAKLAMFADDTCTYSTNRNPRLAQRIVQNQLDELTNYTQRWKIKINPEKTQALKITRNRKPDPPQLTLQNTQIPYQQDIKYLGIHIDNKLTWKKHTQTQTQKTLQTYGQLAPLLNYKSKLALNKKLTIYKQILRPKLLYGCVTFCQAAKTHIKRMQTLQNKILRRITKAPPYLRNADIHNDLKIETIKDYIKNRQLKFIDKNTNHQNTLITNTFQYNIERQTGRHKNIKNPL